MFSVSSVVLSCLVLHQFSRSQSVPLESLHPNKDEDTLQVKRHVGIVLRTLEPMRARWDDRVL